MTLFTYCESYSESLAIALIRLVLTRLTAVPSKPYLLRFAIVPMQFIYPL